jgi:hypothetical protein
VVEEVDTAEASPDYQAIDVGVSFVGIRVVLDAS